MLAGAIDGGGTKVMTGIVDDSGKILSSRTESVPPKDVAAYFNRCAAMLKDCAAEIGVTLDKLDGHDGREGLGLWLAVGWLGAVLRIVAISSRSGTSGGKDPSGKRHQRLRVGGAAVWRWRS